MEYPKKFPENFLWGVSTAAHQVEGGMDNDWTEWEQDNAPQLAAAAGPDKDYGNGTVPNWELIAGEAERPENYISGTAAGLETHWRDDFDLAVSMGMNAIRFSVEWSRVEPSPGLFDYQQISRYRDMVAYAGDIGLKPFITMHHFTSPRWLQREGGFENKQAVERFGMYLDHVVPQISSEGDSWLVINEPETYTGQGWLFGDWPPNKQNPLKMYQVHNNLIEAHKRGYDSIKEHDASAQVSSAVNNIDFEAKKSPLYPVNKAVASVADKLVNHRFHKETMDHQDFIGLNQYMHCVIDGGLFKNDAEEPRSDLGWYLNPESLYKTVMGLTKYNKPIIITEHGLADSRDTQREWYVRESLAQLHRAIDEGADVRGYMHWSLLDNFEWDKGYWPKFGLTEVNRDTMERRIRPSFHAYGSIAINNSL